MKVIDIETYAKKKEAQAGKIKKLQEVRKSARKMGIDTRNVNLTGLRNNACFATSSVQTCGQVELSVARRLQVGFILMFE